MKRHQIHKRLSKWFILFAIIFTFLNPVAQAYNSPANITQSPKSLIPKIEDQQSTNYQIPQTWVVRVYFNSRQQVNDIAAWIEPWEIDYKEGFLLLGVSQAGVNRLLAQGLHLEIDHQYTEQINQSLQIMPNQVTGIPGYPCYRTVDETYISAQQIIGNYPSLAEWIDIGDSWEKITPGGLLGYDMMVLKLTNSANNNDKPKLFIMTAIHPREFATAEINIRFAEYLVENYDVDPDITWLLDFTEIHLLLQSNPDGRKQAESGLSWRKNTNQNYCSPISTSRGADLNRNFTFQWACCGGSSGFECDPTYRGPSPSSEPETQAIQNYVRGIFPDQRADTLEDPALENAMGIFLDIHAYGNLVLWPWGFSNTLAPNGVALQTLGRKFAYFNDYKPDQAIALYPTDGTTDDFAYGELGLAAYTFEVGTTFFQKCNDFENTIFPDNLQALLYAAKTTRTPYITPSGPDTIDLVITPSFFDTSKNVVLKAAIDDTRFSSSNGAESFQHIAAAEYTIDTPPWGPETETYPIEAADGSFNSNIEDVTATIDTTGLADGRHTIFVRGQDADGMWGAISAVFLTVHQSEVYLPLIFRLD